jgi:pimeloyl-ACP methyl ester carboxylesterase
MPPAAAEQPPRERVVLVHGLWLTGHALDLLAYHLRRHGFETSTFSYRTVRATLSENAERLRRFILHLEDETCSLLGHSLGGLLILEALRAHPELRDRLHRVVLAGAPFNDCYAARALARVKGGDRMLGKSIHQWMSQEKRPWTGVPELGVIAGSRSVGLGQVFRGLPKPNDGTITVDETRVPGANDFALMHVSHSEMLISPKFAAQAAAFFRDGRFHRQ